MAIPITHTAPVHTRSARPAGWFVAAAGAYVALNLLDWYFRVVARVPVEPRWHIMEPMLGGAALGLLVLLPAYLALRVTPYGTLVATLLPAGALYSASLLLLAIDQLWIASLIPSDTPPNEFVRGAIVEATILAWFATGVAAVAAAAAAGCARVLRRMRRGG